MQVVHLLHLDIHSKDDCVALVELRLCTNTHVYTHTHTYVQYIYRHMHIYTHICVSICKINTQKIYPDT